MATATKKVVETVCLMLSEDEASTLQQLVGSILGDAEKSPRKHTDAIYIALMKIGIKPAEHIIEIESGYISVK
ncbi:MAG: hypothetical protein P4L79_10130 [Legionella sp.]|uniref:hypothetical protein n=1 Tax=Legionella sp. TaxID=459 RepID=UPI00284196A5|nr:hypothetical protein [Legionella sp.]